jgi:hypothetical protein
MNDQPSRENTSSDKPVFYIREASLVGKLNISRNDLLAIRTRLLQEGVHFAKIGRRVMLSEQGFGLVAKSLEMTAAEADKAVGYPDQENQKKPAQSANGCITPMLFKVTARKTANPHIVLASNGEVIVRVRVKNKENFRPGMVVRCEHVHADLYNLVGNCPRFPGKY